MVHFPQIQCADLRGHVVAGVDEGRVGERVIVDPLLHDPVLYLGADCPDGFAEYVCVSAANAHAMHSLLSDVELASFPCSYSTAENLLSSLQLH